MIVITGAAGFIGSCIISKFNSSGYTDLVLVDDFSKDQKERNYRDKKFAQKIERSEFLKWIAGNFLTVDFVVHIGARTDTTEFNVKIFDELNVEYTKEIWKICTERKIPLIYASS